jgi:sirohydrochlorin ferrochelatase
MTSPSRAKRCRAMAAETAALARLADEPKIREGYLDLARQWTKLAEELEDKSGRDPKN